MVKKSEINKKGRLAKSTLSVVLAASMVLTSSSFVWASPVNEVQVLESEQVAAVDTIQKAWNTAATDFVADDSGLQAPVTYQWYENMETIANENKKQFQGALTADDVGRVIYCIATGDGATKTTAYEITNAQITGISIKTADDTDIPNKEYDSYWKGYDNADLLVKCTISNGVVELKEEDFNIFFEDLSEVEDFLFQPGKVKMRIEPLLKGYELADDVDNTVTYEITKGNLSKYSFIFDTDTSYPFIGKDIDVEPVSGDLLITENDSDWLTLPADSYTVEYEDNKTVTDNAKIAKITAKDDNPLFTGNIGTIINDTFVIEQKDSSFSIEEKNIKALYTGETVVPEVEVVDGDKNSVAATDYTIKADTDSISLGSKKATIESKDVNYTKATKGAFDYEIVANDKAVASFANGASYSYTGSPIEPKIEFADKDGNPIAAVKGQDYEVKYSSNTNVTNGSTATATITFKGGLKGSGTDNKQELKFEITAAAPSEDVVVVDAPKDQKYTYDGSKKTAVVNSVSYKTIGQTLTLKEGTDYKVVVNNQDGVTDVGTYTARIIGLGNYKDSQLGTVKFEIEAAAFSTATLDVTADVMPYTGKPVTPKFKVVNRVSGKTITDYVVKPLNALGNVVTDFPSAIGTHKAVLTPSGKNFKTGGEIYVEYQIGKATLDNAFVVLSAEKLEYNPANGVVPTVDYVGFNTDGMTLKLTESKDGVNGDYKITKPAPKDCKNVGTYTILITGLNNYAGQSKEVTFKVEPKEITKKMVLGKVIAGTNHAGTAAAPYVSGLKDGDYTLVSGTDYEIVNDAANKTVTITGKGNYTTATPIKESYKVTTGMELADPSIQVVVNGTYVYDGKAKEPKIDDIVLTEVYEGGSFTLRKGTDYKTTLSYKNNTAAGKGIIVITGDGSYRGTREVEFDIVGIDIATDYQIDTAALDRLNITYDGKNHATEIKNAVKVSNTKTSAVLAKTSYEVKILQDGKEVDSVINPGIYTVNVEGKDDYSGTLTHQVTVSGVNLDKAANIPSKLDDQRYTGEAVTPEVPVTSKSATIKLEKDKDYTVSYLNNTEVGTAYAVVTGAGIYGGTYLVPFNIVGLEDQEIVVLPAQERDLKKRTLKSKATKVKYSVAPKTEVTYTSSSPDVVTVDAKTGAIEYKAVGTAIITISAAESDTYKAATKELTVKVVPVTPSNVKVTSTSKKKITVKADEVKEATKYQIRIQKDGHSSVYVNVDNKGDLSKVYTTKSSGKFNVWVRAYKTIAGVHHFSAWSAKKAVTVK